MWNDFNKFSVIVDKLCFVGYDTRKFQAFFCLSSLPLFSTNPLLMFVFEHVHFTLTPTIESVKFVWAFDESLSKSYIKFPCIVSVSSQLMLLERST